MSHDLIEDESIVQLDEYLHAIQSAGDTIQFRILYQVFKHEDNKVPVEEITSSIDMEDDFITYCCEKLIDSGLLRQWDKRDIEEVTKPYSYFELTDAGEDATETIIKYVREHENGDGETYISDNLR